MVNHNGYAISRLNFNENNHLNRISYHDTSGSLTINNSLGCAAQLFHANKDGNVDKVSFYDQYGGLIIHKIYHCAIIEYKWRKGKIVNGICYDTDGNIIYQ